MGRVINPDGAGKDRTALTRSVVLAIRELVKQNEANQQTLDLAAYIALALEAIAATIDSSVAAWEKRGYWLKSDRFRMEWAWTITLGQNMRKAVLQQDWAMVAVTTAQIAEKLRKVEVPQRHRLGTPWDGAWDRLSTSRIAGTKNFTP